MIKELYSIAQNMAHTGNPLSKYVYKINKLIVNVCFPLSQIRNTTKGIDENSNVVVSLTTYPARIEIVWITIATLLNQTYKPAKVLLYLSKEQFPNGMEELPAKLIALQNRGLEILFVNDDLKPHKKYYYAFKNYNNYMVITADDDIFYPENHIELLVKAAKKYPNAIICNRAHRIRFEDAHSWGVLPYNSWEDDIITEEPEIEVLPVGCNGVLYRPELFDDEVFNIDHIKECALFTDDLWLKANEIKNGIKAYNCNSKPLIYFDVLTSKQSGLYNQNASDGVNRNDLAWKKLVKLYPEIIEKLKG